ncbi:hypothetical protein [Flavobacterium piscis]|uniref:Tfp pilus assembly protein PilF n=1 Tax=Flavobacterium piscis TaxID=1114874 RepID=A0ABU1YCX4_9FLAO|nr:hypothetical protein [Flavobacterium piscis]MDR7212085.1 Tfp pilus assembly protein PilF [Flavobacterium piscis]
MQLNLESEIESELKHIIQEAILSGSINPDSLRMLILSPDSSYEKLRVYILDEWRDYFYEDDTPIIGEINISKWLDVADEALERQLDLDTSYIEIAKGIDKKYLLTPPAIDFKHLEILEEAYLAFLVCLREELLSQIETALSNVAISFSHADFKNIVGFFTHKLTYNLEDDLLLHAFNNPEGGKGDFYKVELGLPNYTNSDHYLRFLESGIRLFCVEGTQLEKYSEKSEVYSYDISDIAFVYFEDKKIHFRLNDEFHNWTLAPGITKVEKGDKSDEDFLQALGQFLSKFPDKIFSPKNIPHPITENEQFQEWLDKVLEYNLEIYPVHFEKIYNFGEAAYRYYLQQIPKTSDQSERASRFLASKLFYSGRFQESLDIYENALKLANYEKIKCLCAMLFLHQKEKYGILHSSIDSKSEQITLELLDTLWLLRKPLDVDALKSIEEKITPQLNANNRSDTYLVSVVCTKVYSLLNEREKALLHLQSVPTRDTFEKAILEQELKHVDYIMQAYEELQQKNELKIAFDKHVENHSLDTSQKKKVTREKSTYDHSYYVNHKIEFKDNVWVYPLSAESFVAVREENGYELVLAKISSDNLVEIVQQISLPETSKVRSCLYLDGIVYMADAENGITRYKISEKSIELDNIVYKNKKSKAKYETFTISDGYLFASNNEYLEIFELNKPDAAVVSDSLYIRNSYHLLVRHNLLVVGAGSGFLFLVDISDKKNPVCLSMIQEDSTPESMHVEFIDHYMVSRSVYDIKDPTEPKWISYVGHDFASTYYFVEKPKVPIISTGSEFLFTTLKLENGTPVYTNWLESLNAETLDYECAIYNIATAYFGEKLISYTQDEIIFWEKGSSPAIEKIDIHKAVETMVKNCFQFIVDEYPTFSIGKVVLQKPLFQNHIKIFFHKSSSLTIHNDSIEVQALPIISSSLAIYKYYEVELKKPLGSSKMQFEYDGEAIIKQLLQDRRFEEHAARHMLALTDKETSYLFFPTKPWKPFRVNTTQKPKESIKDIILSKNDNRIDLLIEEISESKALLEELLGILNMKIFIPKVVPKLTNKFTMPEGSAEITAEHQEPDVKTNLSKDDVAEEQVEPIMYSSPVYIVDPDYTPKAETEGEANKIPEGFLANTPETNDLKFKAFKILCFLPDKVLVRNILFNGMKFGYLHYNLDVMPDDGHYDELLISKFLSDYHDLWEDFGNDEEIKFFLLSILDKLLNPELQARLAYRYKQYNHPSIATHIRRLLEVGFSYNTYVGEATDIDLSTLPPEVIKPFKAVLLEKFETYEKAADDNLRIEAEQQLVFCYALLNKLGYEQIPEIVNNKLLRAVKEREQYEQIFEEEEGEYEDESIFLVKLYRKAKVKRLIEYYQTPSGSVWPLEEAPELFSESWKQTIKTLLEQGTLSFGDAFKTDYIKRLEENIPLDKSYENDREFAYQLICYTYNHIQKKPEMASLIEPLMLAVDKNKEAFRNKLDIPALKDKNKYTLLQAAWNDLKNQNFDVAEQKADAVLIMDPTMGQVHYLKARLLWLREGIPAYLAQQQYFMEKVAHDVGAQAQLYNLSGCALDTEKKYEEALAYFNKAALLAPTDPIYIANIAEIYYKLGKPKEALKHAKASIANGNETAILLEIIENSGVLI